jgi:NADH-quinone oxidoreductase subunit L
MTIPLMILAFLSLVGGYIGLPVVLGKDINWFVRFLSPVMAHHEEAHLSLSTEWLLILASTVVAITGIFIAYIFYIKKPTLPHNLAARFPGPYRLLVNKYYIDEAYNAVFVQPTIKGSELVYRHFDLKVIDGAVNGTATTAGFFGKILSYLQTGLIKDYALAIILGAVILLGYLLF